MLAIAILCHPALAWEGRVDANGKQLRWQQHTIPFKLNPEGDHGLSETAKNGFTTLLVFVFATVVCSIVGVKSFGLTVQHSHIVPVRV